MAEYKISCSKCGYTVKEEPAYKCPNCGNILEFHYKLCDCSDLKNIDNPGILKYSPVLPVSSDRRDEIVSLEEGDTPVVKSRYFKNEFDLDVSYKLESSNPSGSFKDRAMAVAVTWAKQNGIEKIMIASSGNASAAAAAYA